MYQKIKFLLLSSCVTILTVLANISAASACSAMHYQPQTPRCLQR